MVRKAMVSVALAVALVASLAGCGGGGSKHVSKAQWIKANQKIATTVKLKQALQCDADTLYDSGKFDADEIQQIANGKTKKGSALAKRWYDEYIACGKKAGVPVTAGG